jgi:membrane-bound serine protease (ClpP class)
MPTELADGAEIPISIGDEGVADSTLRPAGRVLFGKQFRDVVTDGSFVEKGSRVRVIKISGTHITVRQMT